MEPEAEGDRSGETDAQLEVGLSSSAAWEACTAQEHRGELSAYLAEAAATTPIQTAAARAVEMLRIGPGACVLDIGCGTGLSLPGLARAVAPTGSVTGLDHAPALLDEARQRVDESGIGAMVQFDVGDAQALPYADDSFDAAHISRVLIHLTDPAGALREACRVVRSGGWVVAIEPDFDGLRIDHVDPEAARLLVAGHSATIRHPAMGLELFRRLDDAGFLEREIAWVTELETVYDSQMTPYSRRAADHAVAAGWMERGRADAAVDYLIDAGARGRYVSYSTLIIGAGRVPSGG
jgi:SAM-dependent methyltransferase